MDAPELKQDVAAIRDTVVARLIRLGLYPKEALAMMDTWEDSWFTKAPAFSTSFPEPWWTRCFC